MPDLARFHTAQAAVIATALAELRSGRKTTHWMWFVFPQLAALGCSETARFYGIADLDEAREYLADLVLAQNLLAATRAVLSHPELPVDDILGDVDAAKLRSSATLFQAAGGGDIFQNVLDAFYRSNPCPLTLAALSEP
jgi:uncharacterized protein (DUF1810 family)